MNVSELARKLRVTPEELKAKLPELGFDIGMRAIKVDDRMAAQIIRRWSDFQREAQKRRREETAQKQVAAAAASVSGPIKIPAVINVRDFALKLNLPVTRLIQELMKNGILASLNERIDFETASIVAEDMGFKIEREDEKEAEISASAGDAIREAIAKEEKEKLVPRPPVVVVMGHVDHGKTMLLDAIRKTNVVAGEAGGITQHIGAYQAKSKDRLLTFVDTPGHEAFTAMRSRGARIADVAVLVVAADDGVQPQTKEAVKIIEAAKIPFVVAINKMDKPEADPERVKRELSELNIIPEEWGGKIPMMSISAKTGKNVAELLDTILIVADLDKEKIVANPAGVALSTVIEAHVDKGEGVVATMLLQNGALRKNDILAVGNVFYGRVRLMRDWNGAEISEALPGMPVRILGFKAAPQVGDIVSVVSDLKGLERAKPVKASEQKMATVERVAKAEEGEKELPTLNLIIRADVLGSLEAVVVSFEKFKHPDVAVNVVGKGLGNITEADITNAEATGALVLGFNVQVQPQVADLASEKNVQVRTYKIIYDLLNNVRDELEKLLPPEVIRTELGRADVLAIFRSEREFTIAGGAVTDGKILMNSRARILRGDESMGEGMVAELQSGKRATGEIRAGQEFGIKVKAKTPLQVGDKLEFYTEERKARKITF
ncbi:translation initiation factor IF-2 [Candidatus Uhrbacteria bacterium]|nr:translation initiation factor IF-2 [Candidatus Uhrbacteria bacterium]